MNNPTQIAQDAAEAIGRANGWPIYQSQVHAEGVIQFAIDIATAELRQQLAALEQRNKEMDSGLCNCSCAELCPLGKVGMLPRCTAHELRRALVALKEGK